MNILIDKIRIAGFRGIKTIEITLPRIAVFIGTNNAGKTSVLKALHLALGDYSRYLTEEDFHIGVDEKSVNTIMVDVRIVPLDDDGNSTSSFSDAWVIKFGDYIQPDINQQQFLALRTCVTKNHDKGSFDIKRSALQRWPDYQNWTTEKIIEIKRRSRFESIQLFSIEAQRDIHQELKERHSYMGKFLSTVQYEEIEIDALESMIQDVNKEAVDKSTELQQLKLHLEQLNQSFQGAGMAEITPFPKRIRDLSKHFSVHFGENTQHSFSMEYHGMGTRSWASILTLKAYTDVIISKHEHNVEPFFPLLCAEEPEAHLHPNAQKTLYQQLAAFNGQVMISTHSPYLAAMAHQFELRFLKKSNDNIEVKELSLKPNTEEYRRLQRELIHSRGEILFSKALILCEGETEEQALPLLFKAYFNKEPFSLGINFIGVKGAGNYPAFLRLAKDFSIPTFIFSDGEPKIIKDLKKHYGTVFGERSIEDHANITLLENTDFEGYLINTGFQSVIESAIIMTEDSGFIKKWIETKDQTSKGRLKTNNPPCITCKQPIFEDQFRDYSSDESYKTVLLDILDSNKTKYAPAIAEQLCALKADKFPPKIIEFFEKIRAGVLL